MIVNHDVCKHVLVADRSGSYDVIRYGDTKILTVVIKSFADKETEKIYQRRRSRRIPADIQHRARRKLLMIKRAHDVNDLPVPPGNRLEVLKGDRAGQYSIRINQQWRICFRWEAGDAFDVEITDHH